MTLGGDDREPARERLRGVPTVVWIMLGGLLVAAFVLALMFVFNAPPSWKSTRSVGAPEQAPAPPSQVAPATPARSPGPTEVR